MILASYGKEMIRVRRMLKQYLVEREMVLNADKRKITIFGRERRNKKKELLLLIILGN